MEGHQPTQNTEQDSAFVLGKVAKADADKKKMKKADDVAEERMKATFNVGGGTSKDHDELKRKREDFAVQLRKKKK